MARQEPKENEKTGADVTRSQPSSGQPHQRGLIRGLGWHPWGLSPAELLAASPFSMLRRMSDEMNRVFGEFGISRGEEAGGMWSPAIEVSERDGGLVVRAELAGVKPEDVKLECTDDAIVIQGERRSEREEKKGGIQLSERRYGSFYRAIPLPEGAKGEEARAKFENGVLEVTVPVQEQERRGKRREIPIDKAA
jgi:HSP20 family protein